MPVLPVGWEEADYPMVAPGTKVGPPRRDYTVLDSTPGSAQECSPLRRGSTAGGTGADPLKLTEPATEHR